jgi:SAM-dependent methyltransferase
MSMVRKAEHFYERSAQSEVVIAGRQYRHITSYLLTFFGGAAFRFLDIGCAAGQLVAQATELSIDAYGLELSNYALKKATAGSFVQADAQCLPFRDMSFDVVSVLEVVEHIPEPERALQECYRVLKEDGILLLSTPSEQGQSYHKVQGGYLEPTHVSERAPASWIASLSKLGFHCKPYSLPFVFSEYDFTVFPAFVPLPARLQTLLIRSLDLYRVMPVRLRFYLEGPLRQLVGVYFSKKLNSFYVVARK